MPVISTLLYHTDTTLPACKCLLVCNAVERLAQYLSRDRIGLRVSTKPALPELVESVTNELLKQLKAVRTPTDSDKWFEAAERISGLGIDEHLLLALPKNSVVASKIRHIASYAKYGASQFGGRLCLVYELHPCVIWHELLHTFEIPDCYKQENGIVLDEGPTCKDERCIMQYDYQNIPGWEGAEPHVCAKYEAALKNLASIQ